MKFDINTNVYFIREYSNGKAEIDMTKDFSELADALRKYLKSLNDVQCRHAAILKSDFQAAVLLRAMAETLAIVADRAIRNGGHESIATTYENLLVTMALYAGEFYDMGKIDLPPGNEGEDVLADFCVKCVTEYMIRPKDEDDPFCDFCMDKLFDRFGES